VKDARKGAGCSSGRNILSLAVVIAAHGDAKLIPDVRVIESPCYAARQQDIAWAAFADVRIRPSITNVQCALVISPDSCDYGKRRSRRSTSGRSVSGSRSASQSTNASDASSSGACTDLDPFRAGPCVMHRSSSWT
jgi:hypothetical protein